LGQSWAAAAVYALGGKLARVRGAGVVWAGGDKPGAWLGFSLFFYFVSKAFFKIEEEFKTKIKQNHTAQKKL